MSDLMNRVDIETLEDVDLEAYQLTEIELERIHKKVVKSYKHTSRKRKKYPYRILLIAATLALGGTSLWALTKSPVFETIFKQNKANLKESGQILELSQQVDNMKVSLRGIVGYEKKLVMNMEVEKTDDVPFEGNTIKLTGYLNIEGDGQSGKYFFEAFGDDLVQSECTATKKVFLVDILNIDKENEVGFTDEEGNFKVEDFGTVDHFKNKKATLVVESIYEEYSSVDYPDLELIQYIDKQSEKESLPFDTKLYKRGRYTASTTKQPEVEGPTKMLAYKKINKPLYLKKGRIKLDNIGFIDGKLHIRLYGDMEKGEEDFKVLTAVRDEGYDLKMIEKVGCIHYTNYAAYESTGHLEQYYIFDIQDIETLKKNPILANIHKTYKEEEVNVEIPFDMSLVAETKTIKLNERIPANSNNVDWLLQEVSLSNVSLDITLNSINRITGEAIAHSHEDKVKVSESIQLILKDGNKIACNGHAYGTWDTEYENPNDNYFGIHIFFMEAIDASKVQSIVIDGLKINVNEL